jgi:dethiobiotin synthetase
MKSLWVVAGTDTDVGKTVTAIGLVRALRNALPSVVAIKPIESGVAILSKDQEDGVRLAKANGQEQPGEALIRLRDPVAPPLAADREGRTLDWEPLLDDVRFWLRNVEGAIIEGAGGLLSPLTWSHTTLDLARELQASLVLVVPDCLGALNQARMAMASAREAGVSVACVVLSGGVRPDHTTGKNRDGLLKCAEFQGSNAPQVLELPQLSAEETGESVFRKWVEGEVK